MKQFKIITKPRGNGQSFFSNGRNVLVELANAL